MTPGRSFPSCFEVKQKTQPVEFCPVGKYGVVMCGRYRLSKRKQLIEEYFEAANEVDWEPRYNIAPSQNVDIIRQDPSRPRREFSQVRWGLIPYWAKEASIGNKMTNARSETVADKSAFREAFKNRRCLVPDRKSVV